MTDEPVSHQNPILPASREALTSLVDELWAEHQKKQPRLVAEKDADTYYPKLRTRSVQLATLAGEVEYATREAILTHARSLQVAYANSVKMRVLAGKGDKEAEIGMLGEAIDELEKLEPDYKVLKDRVGSATLRANSLDVRRLGELQTEMDELDEHKTNKAKLERALSGVKRAARDLDFVLAIQDEGILDYKILPPADIMTQLGEDTYDGIPFDPIRLNARDAFIRQAVLPPGIDITNFSASTVVTFGDITLKAVAPELQVCLALKKVIDGYEPGKVLRPGRIRADLGEQFPDYGSGVLATLIKQSPGSFGIEAEKEERGGNKFTKLPGAPVLNEAQFFGSLLPDFTQQPYAGNVNTFYITRAVERLREDSKIYDNGIRVENAAVEVEKDGFPISNKALAINIGKGKEHYGLRVREGSTPGNRTYDYIEAKPTQRQLESVVAAIPKMGHGAFTLDALQETLSSNGGGYVHSRVIERVLEGERDTLGLRVVTSEPLTYQTTHRPTSAGELQRRYTPDPDPGQLV